MGFLNKNNFQNIDLVMQKYKCVGKIEKNLWNRIKEKSAIAIWQKMDWKDVEGGP